MDHYKKIRSLVIGLEDDIIKFYEKGNNAAGTRVRQDLQALKVLAQHIREDIQKTKNNSSKQE